MEHDSNEDETPRVHLREILPGEVVKKKVIIKRPLLTKLKYVCQTFDFKEFRDIELYKYYYKGQYLGSNQNEAANTAFKMGCQLYNESRYFEAKHCFSVAYETCKPGYDDKHTFQDLVLCMENIIRESEQENENDFLQQLQQEQENENDFLQQQQQEQENENNFLQQPQHEQKNENNFLQQPQQEQENENNFLQQPQHEQENENNFLQQPQQEQENENIFLQQPQQEQIDEEVGQQQNQEFSVRNRQSKENGLEKFIKETGQQENQEFSDSKFGNILSSIIHSVTNLQHAWSQNRSSRDNTSNQRLGYFSSIAHHSYEDDKSFDPISFIEDEENDCDEEYFLAEDTSEQVVITPMEIESEIHHELHNVVDFQSPNLTRIEGFVFHQINDEDQVHIHTFKDNLRQLKQKLLRDSSNQDDVDNVVCSIEIIARSNDLSIQKTNNLIVLLNDSKNAREFLYRSQFSVAELRRVHFIDGLKMHWIGDLCNENNIRHCESDLQRLVPLLNYDSRIVACTLSKLQKVKIDHILNFLTNLSKCELKQISKVDFLVQRLDQKSLHPLLSLGETLIGAYIFSKFSNFANDNNNCFREFQFNYSFPISVIIFENNSCNNLLLAKMHTSLTNCLEIHWDFAGVKDIIDCVDSVEKLQKVIDVLGHVFDYQIYSSDISKEIVHGLKSVNVEHGQHCMNEVHSLIIKSTFPERVDEASIPNLNDENHTQAPVEPEIVNYQRYLLNMPPHNTWNIQNIESWVNFVRKKDLIDKINVVDIIHRAMELASGFKPRDVQKYALRKLLDKERSEDGGRLLQVNTGEGKTCIVAMFAAIMALKGRKVDIITSSPELAIPQCEQQSRFFKMFGLSTSHNISDYHRIKQESYKSDIVYGTAENFQGDILRDEYSLQGTRSGRKSDFAIVDEVDSMLIDDRNHFVMLTASMPGMNNLQGILSIIWNQLITIENSLNIRDGQLYYADELNVDPQPIEETKFEFIQKRIDIYIRKLVRDRENIMENIPDDFPKEHIPMNLRNLVLKVHLSNWIDSALLAKYRYVEGKHYILRNGKISPVDSYNTGVVQENTHFENALHQFLQMKHGVKLTPENFTTNFISNVAFFKRYNRIFGLTGTLGSENSKEMLERFYSVDSVIVPPYKTKQYKQLEPLFAVSESDWFSLIAESCIRKMRVGRVVLIIMECINNVDQLNKKFKELGFEESIRLYKTENDSKSIHRKLLPGNAIIATNIAGRGTDIKVSENFEDVGGLHVCLTFLPVNQRVEEQNFGRTARSGNRGTGQFVLLKKISQSLTALKNARDSKETEALRQAEKDIQKVLRKDEIFKLFCDLLSQIRQINETRLSNIDSDINQKAVEDRFGIWLKEYESMSGDEQTQFFDKFSLFRDAIMADNSSDRVITNPYFHILKGNNLLSLSDFNGAIKEYSDAIKLDDHFLSNAYYNRGISWAALYSQQKEIGYLKKAADDFKKARTIIKNHIEPMLMTVQKASDAVAVSNQIQRKLSLYGMQKEAIDSAIGKGSGNIENDDRCVIGKVIAKNHRITVSRSSITESLPRVLNQSLFENEIKEFENNGNLGRFEIKIVPSTLLSSIIGLAHRVADALKSWIPLGLIHKFFKA